MRAFAGIYRIVFCLLTAVAIVVAAVHQTTGLPNFVSYFTIESNALAVVVFGWGGMAAFGPLRPPPDLLRGATALYLTITGLVYGILLSGYDTGVIPWVNMVVHHVMPVVLVLDWLIDPPRTRVSTGRAMWWLVFPIVFLGYSLIRGPIVGWYPYPFLDPHQHGYLRVTITCVCIAAAFVVVTLVLVWLGRMLGARRRSGTAARADAMSAS